MTSFNETNGVRIYKELEDKSALVVPSTDMETVVIFSIVVARAGSLLYTWTLPEDENDPRLISAATRPFVSVRPIFLDGDTSPTIRVRASLADDMNIQRYFATLNFLGMLTVLLLHHVVM